MATAPKLIVYTIPVDGSDPKLEDLHTIEAPILELTNPDKLKPRNQARLDVLRAAATMTHLVYDLPEGAQKCIHQGVDEGRYQPNVRLLPDTRTRWKSEGWDGWEKRAAIEVGKKGHHVFYSRGKGGPLGLNKHANDQVSGDIFILKLSDTRDESGRRFYVDFNTNPNIYEEGKLAYMVGQLFQLQYYGTEHKGTSILAYVLPQDGSSPHTQLIGATPTPLITRPNPPPFQTPSERAIYDRMMAKGFFSHVNFWGHDHTIQMRILPDLQPGHPGLSGGAYCATIGDTNYHMLLTLAEPGKAWSDRRRNPHISGFPVWGEVCVFKVSRDLDCHNNWFYEDIDEDFELPQGMLSLYTTQLAKIWKDLGGEERRSGADEAE